MDWRLTTPEGVMIDLDAVFLGEDGEPYERHFEPDYGGYVSITNGTRSVVINGLTFPGADVWDGIYQLCAAPRGQDVTKDVAVALAWLREGSKSPVFKTEERLLELLRQPENMTANQAAALTPQARDDLAGLRLYAAALSRAESRAREKLVDSLYDDESVRMAVWRLLPALRADASPVVRHGAKILDAFMREEERHRGE